MSDIVYSHAGVTFWMSLTPQNGDMNLDDFLAVTDWVRVSNMGSLGEYGLTTNLLNYDALNTLVSTKAKGISNAGEPALEFARDDDDQGQINMAAIGVPFDFNSYAFKIDKQDGATDYIRGLCSGPAVSGGRNEDFDLVTFTVAINQVIVHELAYSNPVKPPLNFMATPNPDGSDVLLTWDENPANDPATANGFFIERSDLSGTISRPAGVYEWLDPRDLDPGETITWSIYLQLPAGDSDKVYASATVPSGWIFDTGFLAADGIVTADGIIPGA